MKSPERPLLTKSPTDRVGLRDLSINGLDDTLIRS